MTAFLGHFLVLPSVAVLDLCLIPKLGNTLVTFLRTQLQRGLEWRLSGLLFAYTDLSQEGLVELEGLLRLLTSRLKYMVVSGACPPPAAARSWKPPPIVQRCCDKTAQVLRGRLGSGSGRPPPCRRHRFVRGVAAGAGRAV